jgi:creatinine amidohydrolase/Fe(II)-dependent formamide hydrolase-like protein
MQDLLKLSCAGDKTRTSHMKKAKKGAEDQTLLREVTSSYLNRPSSFTKITKNGVWGDPSYASPNEGKNC